MAGCSDPNDQDSALFIIPNAWVCLTTQSKPKLNKSSASLSSVHTQTRFELAPNSVIAFKDSGRLFQGVSGFPPLKKIHKPASSRSFVKYFSSAS